MTDAPRFRDDFPEFSDSGKYPSRTLEFWLSVGGKLLRPERWGDLLDHGLELFTAHHLALSAKDQAAAARGLPPGLGFGNETAKSVDKVSVSIDAGSVYLDGGGHWNLTTYGIQFLQLARLVGAGGVQVV
jgi:hypothetical protein